MSASVVHLKRKGGAEVVSCDVYIGRAMFQGGWSLPASKWANPYRLNAAGTNRREVLEKYRDHVRTSPALMASLPELRGRVLGCWCVGPTCLVCGKRRAVCGHLQCHGEVLIELLSELDSPTSNDVPPPELSEGKAGLAARESSAPVCSEGDIDDLLDLFRS